MTLAKARAGTDASEWLERVEAVKLLAAAGALEHDLALALWERAPEVYQADLIAAAAFMEPSAQWAGRFLATAGQHPVHTVVRSNVASQVAAQTTA